MQQQPERWVVLDGEALDRLREMPDASVDSCVCDPPYGLSREPDVAEMLQHWLAGDDYQHRGAGFMGKSWDSFVPGPSIWREVHRVLKPGGYLLAFGGTRTYDLLVLAVRLAGFEVRDQIAWLYGQGFPKSLDVSKAIDKAAGAQREVLGEQPDRWTGAGDVLNFATDRPQDTVPVTGGPVTPEAQQWEGWGTALKPAQEPIVVARKPLVGTVAQNVLAHGTGAINVDGCLIAGVADRPGTTPPSTGERDTLSGKLPRVEYEPAEGGRWPANLVLDEEAAEALDEQTGILASGSDNVRREAGADRNGNTSAAYGAESRPAGAVMVSYGDSGGASRFFYVAKASPAERNAGLWEFEAVFAPTMGNGIGGKEHDPATATPKKNRHPTVKPIALMRWLCRLVTPPDGLVLDPFCGSGSTGCGAVLEGFRFTGIERGDPPGDPAFANIARARIAWWEQHPEGVELVRRLEAERARRELQEAGQEALF